MLDGYPPGEAGLDQRGPQGRKIDFALAEIADQSERPRVVEAHAMLDDVSLYGGIDVLEVQVGHTVGVPPVEVDRIKAGKRAVPGIKADAEQERVDRVEDTFELVLELDIATGVRVKRNRETELFNACSRPVRPRCRKAMSVIGFNRSASAGRPAVDARRGDIESTSTIRSAPVAARTRAVRRADSRT